MTEMLLSPCPCTVKLAYYADDNCTEWPLSNEKTKDLKLNVLYPACFQSKLNYKYLCGDSPNEKLEIVICLDIPTFQKSISSDAWVKVQTLQG